MKSHQAEDLFDRIERSPLFGQFRTAFEAATGAPLELHDPASPHLVRHSGIANAFCRTLNAHSRCPDCTAAVHCIHQQLSREPSAIQCFAGLKESAVPIWAAQVPIGYLVTGQVFLEGQPPVAWDAIAAKLIELGHDAASITVLESAWRQTRRISGEKYAGMVTLMAVFAGQLSELADRLLLEQSQSEPPVVVKARQFVNAHLAETIELNQVAGHVGVSPFHFCRLFKQATGLTLKQYVTRRRVEWAKCRLRQPHVRATEVAYDVGFGSLSQFNRSFQQVVGSSPSEWRSGEARKLALAGG